MKKSTAVSNLCDLNSLSGVKLMSADRPLNLGCAFGFLRLNKYCSENQSCKRTNKDELKWECLSPWITQQAVSICCIFCAGGNMQMQQWESETKIR